MFKVVPDQLRVSQGWVRCGQCDEVFDANVHTYAHSQEVAQDVDAFKDASLAPNADLVLPQSASQYDWSGVLGAGASAPTNGGGLVDAFLEKSPPELEAQAPDIPSSEIVEKQSSNDARSGRLPLAHGVGTSRSHPYRGAGAMLYPKPQSRPQSLAMRWLWRTLLLLLVIGLVLQGVWHVRDRLASAQPLLKTGFLAICTFLPCRIAAPKQIESFVIDSSSLVRVQPSVYQLKVTLKNIAGIELEKPAIEVTLTDTQDQTLIRKVIHPSDIALPSAHLAPAGEVVWSIPIRVKAGEGDFRFAGYRVLVFYP